MHDAWRRRLAALSAVAARSGRRDRGRRGLRHAGGHGSAITRGDSPLNPGNSSRRAALDSGRIARADRLATLYAAAAGLIVAQASACVILTSADSSENHKGFALLKPPPS